MLAIGFAARYLPETKGLPVEEISRLFDRAPGRPAGDAKPAEAA